MPSFTESSTRSAFPFRLGAASALLAVIAVIGSTQPTTAQTRPFTISGVVTDADSHESLVAATVQATGPDGSTHGVTTDRYGRFSFPIPTGPIQITVRHVGYVLRSIELTVAADTFLTIPLAPATLVLDSLVVQGSRTNDSPTSTATVRLSPEEIRRIPALGGEPDAVKAFQLMPGVAGGREGEAGLYVRGGSPDQNLVLLDGTPVYNVNHLVGFLSVLNPEAIRSVALSKGPGPARFGGRLSSTLDVALREGNRDHRQRHASVSPVSGAVTFDGPIRGARSSYLFAIRRTWLDQLYKRFQPPKERYGYNFYDTVAKLSRSYDRGGFYVSVYAGRDNFWGRSDQSLTSHDEKYRGRLGWGNLTTSIRWQGVVGSGVLMQASAYRTHYSTTFRERYDSTYRDGSISTEAANFVSGITDLGLTSEIELPRRNRIDFRAGASGVLHHFTPGSHTASVTSATPGDNPVVDETGSRAGVAAFSSAIFSEAEVEATDAMSFSVGLRFSNLFVDSHSWILAEPRLAINLQLRPSTNFEVRVDRSTQFVHLLSRSGIGVPLDLWMPSTASIGPESGWQYSLGCVQILDESGIRLNADIYYRTMSGLVEPLAGSSLVGIDAANWEQRVETGNGQASGLELLARRESGRLTGWVAYTLARSTRTFDGIDRGMEFPYRFDRRHDFAVTTTYRLTERWIVSATWVFATGNALWLPSARVPSIEDDAGYRTWPERDPSINAYVYDARNAAREPNYHRLDFSFRKTRQTDRGTESWTIGLYNAYARRNPFFISAREQEDGSIRYYQISPFVLIPAINYEFEF
ncbi:MAG: TonB-dependent receptor [Rhodothermales bacterium]